MAYLKVLKGTGLDDRIDLDVSRCLMGRHPSCHVVVEANSVSRQHAQIVRDGDHWLVEDLKSRNGTFVNDRPVAGRQPLSDGDLIKICDFVFRFNGGLGLPSNGLRGTIDDSSVVPVRIQDKIFEEEPGDHLPHITARLDLTQAASPQVQTISAEEKLRTLIEITQSLSKTLMLDEVLPKVLESLFQIFVSAERGFIFLVDDNDQPQVRWYLTRKPGEREENLRVSRTIVNHVLDTQEAILSADAASDQRFDLSHSIAAHHVRSIMCAPIIDSDGKSIGCIQIDTFSLNARFKDEGLEVLATVAMQAGIAIDNARLLEDALNRREVERDLELAHEVQSGILPRSKPKLKDYDFFTFYQPAHQIGGDYYDYVQLRDGRVAVLVADVVGHGIPAALLMAKFSSEARFALATQESVREAVETLNRTFSNLSFERFVTMVVAVIDPVRHRVSFVNAAHNPPLIRQAGNVTELPRENSGMPIGITPDLSYQERQIELAPGDAIVMFTDGVTESVNLANQQYSTERLANLVRSNGPIKSDLLGENIVDDVLTFTEMRPFVDDVCLVCFNRRA